MTIPLFKPFWTEEENIALKEVIDSGWWGLGPKTKEFEDKFSQYIGVKYAIGVNSCTSALHLASVLLGLGTNDIVLVPTITFVSTAHAASYCGCKVVFCDVDQNGLLDFEDVKRARDTYQDQIKAIIPVHYAGRCVNISLLRKIINVPIIEDCAHAAGSTINNMKAGSLGDIGCFSFHAVKNIAAGDGGMITTNNPAFDQRARKLRWLGIDKGTWSRNKSTGEYLWQYSVEEIGFKYHMNDLQAALGLTQLNRLEQANQARRTIASYYRKYLPRKYLSYYPKEDTEETRHSWHIFPIRLKDPFLRDPLMMFLQKHEINSGVHYLPIHRHSCYSKQYRELPNADLFSQSLISLPIHPNLTEDDIKYICNTIHSFFEKEK